MPEGTRYALVREPANALHKPSVFETVHGLGRAIHRAARGAPVELVEEYFTFRGEETPRRGVNCWRLDPFDRNRVAFIGWAWLDGGDRFLLSAAMPQRKGGLAAIRAA